MKKKNILVFPCGSEVGLEIYRSLENSIHCFLIGANSIDDHGRFVYKNFIGDLPFINDNGFIKFLKEIVDKFDIHAIYPAMDSVVTVLKKHEEDLGCKVIASKLSTTEICLSKSKTYQVLQNVVLTPDVFSDLSSINKYPVFLKPDIGYGSRGTKKASNELEIQMHLKERPNSLILEFLPGREYTIDCFTDFKGELLFVGARERKRISNGISVNTSTMPLEDRFLKIAKLINSSICFNGAWFFQAKERADGDLVLLEIASRMAGSSAAYRAKGINFALLSIFNAFEEEVSIMPNDYEVQLDRALNNRYKVDISFSHVYVDFDDTLIIDGKLNTKLILALFHFLNDNKRIYLITKHAENIYDTLKVYRINNLFDEVIHIKKDDLKWKYIKHTDAIFIDDSFSERKQVKVNIGIPVFGLDMIEVLI